MMQQVAMRLIKSTILASLFSILMTFQSPLLAAELIMLEQQGCVWCQKWHAEIGPGYPNSSEGKRAPLRLVDINKPIPEDLVEIRIERFTPTFILVEDGRELGRIRGYPGDEFFWFLLGEMLDQSLNKPG